MSTGSSDDFEFAFSCLLTCKECKHCQMNKKVQDRIMDWSCYHPDNMQVHLHGKKGMTVSSDFLCNKFEVCNEI